MKLLSTMVYCNNLNLIISKFPPQLLLVALVDHHYGGMTRVLPSQPTSSSTSSLLALVLGLVLAILSISLRGLW